MRYPLWAFFAVLVMPIFTLHALLTDQAELSSESGVVMSAERVSSYWTHHVASR